MDIPEMCAPDEYPGRSETILLNYIAFHTGTGWRLEIGDGYLRDARPGWISGPIGKQDPGGKFSYLLRYLKEHPTH